MKRLLAMIAVAGLVSACGDDGPPSGPGALTARVVSDGGTVGSAVVQVIGQGIQGFEPEGGSRVFTRSTGEDTYRVLVVDPGSDGVAFRIRVEDVSAQVPTAAVFSAADTSNDLVPSSTSLSVAIER